MYAGAATLSEFLCILFCLVYYLKVTFGPGTGEAVLEIPVSVTGNKYLLVDYYISSSRIELAVIQSKDGNTTVSEIEGHSNYTGGWSDLHFPLDSNVEAVQMVAKKIGVTTNVEYVLVDDVKVILDDYTGMCHSCIRSLHCLLLERCCICTRLLQSEALSILGLLYHIHCTFIPPLHSAKNSPKIARTFVHKRLQIRPSYLSTLRKNCMLLL